LPYGPRAADGEQKKPVDRVRLAADAGVFRTAMLTSRQILKLRLEARARGGNTEAEAQGRYIENMAGSYNRNSAGGRLCY